MVNLHKKLSFLIKISKFLSVKAVIPLTVNKIASSGVFGPLYTSFPLYGSPLNGSFTVIFFSVSEDSAQLDGVSSLCDIRGPASAGLCHDDVINAPRRRRLGGR